MNHLAQGWTVGKPPDAGVDGGRTALRRDGRWANHLTQGFLMPPWVLGCGEGAVVPGVCLGI